MNREWEEFDVFPKRSALRENLIYLCLPYLLITTTVDAFLLLGGVLQPVTITVTYSGGLIYPVLMGFILRADHRRSTRKVRLSSESIVSEAIKGIVKIRFEEISRIQLAESPKGYMDLQTRASDSIIIGPNVGYGSPVASRFLDILTRWASTKERSISTHERKDSTFRYIDIEIKAGESESSAISSAGEKQPKSVRGIIIMTASVGPAFVFAVCLLGLMMKVGDWIATALVVSLLFALFATGIVFASMAVR